MKLQAENPELHKASTTLKVGLLVKHQKAHWKDKTSKVIGLDFGWEDEASSDQRLVRNVRMQLERDPVAKIRRVSLILELYPWDKTTFAKTESGVSHTLKNNQGNVEVRQAVISVAALDQMLEKLLAYSASFLIHHCKLPTTIKV